MAEVRAAQAGDIGAIAAIDPHHPGRLAGLDEDDPEHVFFHDRYKRDAHVRDR